jgi:hypothetical protein
MKTNMMIQSLGLAAVMTVSASAFAAYGYDEPARHGAPAYQNGPAFNGHPMFQNHLRLINEVNERQDKQMDRILNGFYDKRISPVEFRRLMDEQRAIRVLERQSLIDGVLNPFEYQKLDAALDVASRNIFQQAHDDDGRPNYGNYGGGWNQSGQPNGGYGHWGR